MKKIFTLALICGLITLAMPSKAEAGIEGRYNTYVALNALNNVAAAHLASSLVTSPAHNYAYMAANRVYYQPSVYYNSYSRGYYGNYGYNLGAYAGPGMNYGYYNAGPCGYCQAAYSGLPASYYLGFQIPAYGHYNGGSYYAPRYEYRYENRQIQKNVVKNYYNETRNNTTYGGDYTYNAKTHLVDQPTSRTSDNSYYYNGTPDYSQSKDAYSYNGQASYSNPSSTGGYSYNGVTSGPEYSYNGTVSQPDYTYNGQSSNLTDNYSYNGTASR